MNEKDGDTRRAEQRAVADLQRITDNKFLNRMLSEHRKGKLGLPDFQSALRVTLSLLETETAAVNHLRRVTRDPMLKNLLRRCSASEFKKAIAEILPKAAWQRCYLHFLRNALDHMPRKRDNDCLQELRASNC